MNLDFPKAFDPLIADWCQAQCVRQDATGKRTVTQGQVLCSVIPGEHITQVQAGYGHSTGQRIQVKVATTYWPSGDEPDQGDQLTHVQHGVMTVQDMNHDGAAFWDLTCIAKPRNARN